MLTFDELTDNPREFLAATGLKLNEFEVLLAEYAKAYMIKYPANKTYPLQMMHGLQFGLSQAQANYWIHRLLPVLREALAQLKLTPERDGE